MINVFLARKKTFNICGLFAREVNAQNEKGGGQRETRRKRTPNP